MIAPSPHTYIITWKILPGGHGFTIEETFGMGIEQVTTFGPLPDIATCDALIIERKKMINDLLRGQMAALDRQIKRARLSVVKQ